MAEDRLAPPRRPSVADLLLGASVAYALVLMVTFLFFVTPDGDLFGRYLRGDTSGILASVAREYRQWSGRWSGITLSYLVAAWMDLTTRLTMLLVGVTTLAVFAVTRFAGALTEGRLGRGRCLMIGLAFLALYWTGMPAPAASIYFATGALENFLSISIALLVVTQLLLHPTDTAAGSRRIVPLALAAAGAFVMVGMHELFGSLLLMVLAAGTVQAFRLRRDAAKAWLAVTAAGALGWILVVTAPGNAARMSSVDRRHARDRTLDTVLEQMTDQGLAGALDWLLDPRLLGALVLLITAPSILGLRLAWPARRRAGWRLLVPAGFAGMLVSGFAVAAWGLAGRVPARTMNGLYYIFLLAFLVIGLLVSQGLGERLGRRPSAVRRLRLIAAIVVLLAIGLPWPHEKRHNPLVYDGPLHYQRERRLWSPLESNATLALEDLRYRLGPFRGATERRFEALSAAAATETEPIVVEPLPARPSMLRASELSHRADSRINRWVAHYFGLAGVRVPDAGSNELLLGHGILGRLSIRGAQREEPGEPPPVRQADGVTFELGPLPAPATPVSVVVDLPPAALRGLEPVGAQIDLAIRRSNPAWRPTARVALELRSGRGGRGALLGSAETVVARESRWHPLRATLDDRPSRPLRSIVVTLRADSPRRAGATPVVSCYRLRLTTGK